MQHLNKIVKLHNLLKNRRPPISGREIQQALDCSKATRQRFPRSLHNLLHVFAPKTDQTLCFMNSGAIPELVFQQTGTAREILHPDFFSLLQRQAQP